MQCAIVYVGRFLVVFVTHRSHCRRKYNCIRKQPSRCSVRRVQNAVTLNNAKRGSVAMYGRPTIPKKKYLLLREAAKRQDLDFPTWRSRPGQLNC